MLLIRHGQSEFNVHYGRTRQDPGIRDPRLTEKGRADAAAAARLVAGSGIVRLIASPYRRALETAAIIADALDLPIVVDARVGERAAFACDVGTPVAELRRDWPRLALDHLEEIWWPELEESETLLGLRCEAFRAGAAGHPEWQSLGVVTHWGFIRGLTGLTVGNGAVVRIDPRRPAETAEIVGQPEP